MNTSYLLRLIIVIVVKIYKNLSLCYIRKRLLLSRGPHLESLVTLLEDPAYTALEMVLISVKYCFSCSAASGHSYSRICNYYVAQIFDNLNFKEQGQSDKKLVFLNHLMSASPAASCPM